MIARIVAPFAHSKLKDIFVKFAQSSGSSVTVVIVALANKYDIEYSITLFEPY